MAYIYLMHPDNRIRELRKRARMSQAELGRMVGLHQTQVGNIENSQRSLTIEWARRFAKALNVAVADLLVDEDNPYRLDHDEHNLVSTYRHASDDQRRNINRVAEALSEYRPAASDRNG